MLVEDGDVPPKVGGYRLVEATLKRRRFNTYLAVATTLRRERLFVAHVDNVAEGPDALNAWLRRMRPLVEQRHPNLLTMIDIGEIDSRGHVVTELVEGYDLDAVWARCAKERLAFPVELAAHIVREICCGYAHAHEVAGDLAYRSVPGKALFLTASGDVQVDFGLASMLRRVNEHGSSVTSYLSPEELRGAATTQRSSVYSAGVVLWELLTGVTIFLRESAGEDSRSERPWLGIRRPGVVSSRVPSRLDKISRRALWSVRWLRYRKCADFAAELESFLAERGWSDGRTKLAQFMEGLFAEDLARDRAARAKLLLALPPRTSA